MKPAVRLFWYAATLVLLVLVFALYGQPDFVMTVANQIWGCF